jgi:hypothetical protein
MENSMNTVLRVVEMTHDEIAQVSGGEMTVEDYDTVAVGAACIGGAFALLGTDGLAAFFGTAAATAGACFDFAARLAG